MQTKRPVQSEIPTDGHKFCFSCSDRDLANCACALRHLRFQLLHPFLQLIELPLLRLENA
jgi:hypothetical protein